MKTFIIAAACFLGYSAAQGSIEKDAEWTVSGLSASSLPGPQGSLTTHYSFTVTTSTQSAQCDATSNQTGAPLGSLPETACDPDTFSFSWTPKGDAGSDGATLEIWDSVTEQFATHDIPADEIHQQPEFVLGSHPYVYNGPSDFIVETQLD
ncbi:hypothetical protein PFICI_13966 [Pestalotiopsis fici W106-1]|uniref:AA1-like domain-containing protein n=1 Tax=Pestalotiopsis fici (strain W106-1 / CGMCC3.15140) TaxID=1229662 RepID=W3WJJ3_PESFW|nr:uncharacterized protein PFICI_13966 [Pestalotiopsis fici W106-1]ETS74100.1 hypothetical protein PFICI_13966 [Pestalotiopsis fici W106-1]